jgi:hypothetical protein
MAPFCPSTGSCNPHPVNLEDVLACRALGHRYRFWTEGATMLWECERCGHPGGSKTYASTADANRYALAFDREDREALQRRPAMLSLLPLRLFGLVRRRAVDSHEQGGGDQRGVGRDRPGDGA